jgi:phosphonate transport system substrate-binding protein
MSNSLPPMSTSSPDCADNANTTLVAVARALLYLSFVAAISAICYAQYESIQANHVLQRSQTDLVNQFGVTAPSHKHLAPDYSDQNGRLLADPPTDPAKLLNPDTIVIAYGTDSDLDVQPIAWEEFQAYLAEVSGKKVETRVYQNTPDEVAAVKDGKMHVVALHAADAPYLVNNAGFIPVAVVGTDGGAAKGNRLDLAVRAGSSIHNLADVRGHTLTCSTPVSITGHRAAVALLLQEASLRPDVDYSINFSLGQKRSVQGLADGEFEVAALSDDKVQSLLKAGRIKDSDFHIIYQSQVIPRFTIGYIYNLQPELANKITESILDFRNEKGPVAEGSEKPMRFVAVDYKKDFEFVRKIDESFDPRLGPKPPKVNSSSDALDGPPQT